MAPARRPFNPGPSTTSGDGAPATAMPPSPGRIGAMPSMPMGGSPGQQPRGPQTPSAGQRPSPNMGPSPGMPVVPPPMGGSPGGPTAPGNIGQMLQAQMGDQSQQPQGGAPMGSMPPWGDNGTRPSTPGRVPVTMGIGGPGMPDPGMDDGAGMPMGNGDGSANMPTVMMKLLRGLGKV